jgi:hypothetical protein
MTESNLESELTSQLKTLPNKTQLRILGELFPGLELAAKERMRPFLNRVIWAGILSTYAHGLAWVWLSGNAAAFAFVAACVSGIAAFVVLMARFA